jgi:hypothetical protein
MEGLKMEKQKITVYYTNEFFGSVTSVEGVLVEHGRQKYAQYDDAPFVVFVPKGKRKAIKILKSHNPYLLILNGWNNPKSEGLFAESITENGITIQKSKYQCYDKRYQTDFNRIINKCEPFFIADYRENKAVEPLETV